MNILDAVDATCNQMIGKLVTLTDTAHSERPKCSDPYFFPKIMDIHKNIYDSIAPLYQLARTLKVQAAGLRGEVKQLAVQTSDYTLLGLKLLRQMRNIYKSPSEHNLVSFKAELDAILNSAPRCWKESTRHIPKNASEIISMTTCSLYQWNIYKRIYKFSDELSACLGESLYPDMNLDFLMYLPYDVFCIASQDDTVKVIVNRVGKTLYCTSYSGDDMVFFKFDISKTVQEALAVETVGISPLGIFPQTFAFVTDMFCYRSYNMKTRVTQAYEVYNAEKMKEKTNKDSNEDDELSMSPIEKARKRLGLATVHCTVDARDNTFCAHEELECILREVLGCVCYLASNNCKTLGISYEVRERSETAPNDPQPLPQDDDDDDFNEAKIGIVETKYIPHAEGGTAVRYFSSQGTGRKRAPHVRRGHWHRYWVGKHGTEDRKCIVKFLPPMWIGNSKDAPIHTEAVATSADVENDETTSLF